MKRNNLPKLSFEQMEQEMLVLSVSENRSIFGGTDGPPRTDCFFATLAGMLNSLNLPLSYSSASLQSQYTSIMGSAPTTGVNSNNQALFLGTSTYNQYCPYNFGGAVRSDNFGSSQMGSYLSSTFASGNPMMVSYINPDLGVSHVYKVESIDSNGKMTLVDTSGQGLSKVTTNKNDSGIASAFSVYKRPGVTSENATDPGAIPETTTEWEGYPTTSEYPESTTEFAGGTTTEF
ncbi:hypothetical protein [Pedobacter frigoris]|uniref:Uncharacterized protein n=1 Tax=Pedobacter frigoris TaxID=2571272 RepID=A0A4U1CKH8_9SPHI|nr:hypothetical protein [Pedobacter frigoris]TKC07332.1 hypothetical protein FA047_08735 [Pedobacter frigoris]